MLEPSASVPSLEELSSYVAEVLGSFESLKVDQCQLSQNILMKAGKPCGIYFCLQGPRALKLSAIWETEQNTILFYGSCGRRMHRTKLVKSPPLGSITIESLAS